MFDSKQNRNIIIGLVVLLMVSGGVIFTMYKRMSALTVTKVPETTKVDEVANVISAVGKLIVLPTDETPTIATVSDPEKLKDQVFFANAVAGDKVLIYQQNKKAILYSPSLNKIIEIAPINLNTQTPPAPAPAPAPASTVTKKVLKK